MSALLDRLEKKAGVARIGGSIIGGAERGGQALSRFARRHSIKLKAEFRRGRESSLGITPKARRAGNIGVSKEIAQQGNQSRMKDFTRKALTYGGIGLGAAGVGAGAYAWHKHKKKQEEQAYPTGY